jgi:Fur family transcriptional regulator, peroxide stress response regulator
MNRRKFSNQDLDRIRGICEEAGIKLTHQRLEIFKELMTAADHPSAEDIHRRLQKRMPTVAIDTVYRTLATFDELGIARKVHLANNRNLFDTNLTPHHHFICDRCRKVEDIYWPDFDKASLPEQVSGIGQVRSRHLELNGLCNTCLELNGK